MSRTVRVDLFAEDTGHEAILRPLVKRVSAELGLRAEINVRSAVGGHAIVMQQLASYFLVLATGEISSPDVLVICIDANCATYPRKRAEIEAAVPAGRTARAVIACPDPHIEKWYLSDPESLVDVFGARPRVPKKKCERAIYKSALGQAVVDGGGFPTLGGIEFASDIANSIDLYRAGKNEKSLQQFLTDLRSALKASSSESR